MDIDIYGYLIGKRIFYRLSSKFHDLAKSVLKVQFQEHSRKNAIYALDTEIDTDDIL